MSLLIYLVVLSSMLGPAQAPCVGSRGAPALDHVVLVVRDLDSAAAAFRKQGFRIKPGRLHSNNLLNRHIKFRDGSSLELMSLAGPPGDAMARDYAELLTQGEGGVYVALSVRELRKAQDVASARGLQVRRSSSGPWQFLSFPGSSPAAALFFDAGGRPVQDPDSLTSHQPDAAGLAEVWVEGGAALSDLLESVGAKRCGTARARGGQVGERWALRRGSLVVVPMRSGVRPRVLGVVLQSGDTVARRVTPLPTFWLDYAHFRGLRLQSAGSRVELADHMRNPCSLICFVFLAIAGVSPVSSQRPISFDFDVGVGSGRSSAPYLTGRGPSIGALVAFPLGARARGGFVAAVGGSGQGFGVVAACDVVPGGSCAPDFPTFWIISALAGWETRNGYARLLFGPGLALARSEQAGAAQARLDLALPVSSHLALLAATRLAYIPNQRSDSFTLGAVGVGFRLR